MPRPPFDAPLAFRLRSVYYELALSLKKTDSGRVAAVNDRAKSGRGVLMVNINGQY